MIKWVVWAYNRAVSKLTRSQSNLDGHVELGVAMHYYFAIIIGTIELSVELQVNFALWTLWHWQNINFKAIKLKLNKLNLCVLIRKTQQNINKWKKKERQAIQMDCSEYRNISIKSRCQCHNPRWKRCVGILGISAVVSLAVRPNQQQLHNWEDPQKRQKTPLKFTIDSICHPNPKVTVIDSLKV